MSGLNSLTRREVISNMFRQLRSLPYEDTAFQVNRYAPTVMEIIMAFVNEDDDERLKEFGKNSYINRKEWAEVINLIESKSDEIVNSNDIALFYLGQLDVTLKTIASGNKKSMLIRLFD